MSLAENLNPITHTDQFLVKKKGVGVNQKSPNALRNLVKNQQEQEQYKQSKPFSKKYGNHRPISKNLHNPAPETSHSYSNQPKSEKQMAVAGSKPEVQHKNHTKHSFNKKLNNNIIKDQKEPSTHQNQPSRVKPAEGKILSPKKTRDNLLLLNEEQGKLQTEILQIHKSTKAQLERVKQLYKIQPKKLTTYLSQIKNEEGKAINWQQSQHSQLAIQKLSQLVRQKSKILSKLEQEITSNAYIQYLDKAPSNIDQMNSSEEDDLVQDLPQERPKLEGNHGSYSITMTSMRHKNYALNQRRTYDVFKNEESGEAQTNAQSKVQAVKEEVIKQQGQNRMTLNQKFKDFLLN